MFPFAVGGGVAVVVGDDDDSGGGGVGDGFVHVPCVLVDFERFHKMSNRHNNVDQHRYLSKRIERISVPPFLGVEPLVLVVIFPILMVDRRIRYLR